MSVRRVRFTSDTTPLLEDCISALCNSHLSPLSSPEAHQQITYLIKGFKRDEREFHQAMVDQTRPSTQPKLPLLRLRAVLRFHKSLVDAPSMQRQMDRVVDWLDLALDCMSEPEEVCSSPYPY